MLDRYVGEWMALIIKIKNDIKEPARGYWNFITSQISIFGEYLKVWESLYTWVINWVTTILNHIDMRAIYLGVKGLARYIDLNGIENKNNVKYPYPTGIKKCEILNMGF